MLAERLKIWRPHKHLMVAILDDEAGAIGAVRRLHRLGIDNDRVSLLALDTERVHEAIETVGPFEGKVLHAGETVETLAHESSPKGLPEAEGMLIGGCVGLVLGLGVFAIPGFGAMVLAAGPVGWAVNVFAHSIGGSLGLGMLLGAIFDERVSEAHLDDYREQLQAGRWLLAVHGDDASVQRAATDLQGLGLPRVETY